MHADRRGEDPRLLPQDPDVDVDESPAGEARPVHARWRFIVLVFVGGTLGTAAREALSLVFPPVDGVPYAILAINIAGALLLGVLLEALARRGPDRGRRRMLRLTLGTGVMGGFTTYSALAADSAALIGQGATGRAIAYATTTLVVGAVATAVGIVAASAAHRRRESRLEARDGRREDPVARDEGGA